MNRFFPNRMPTDPSLDGFQDSPRWCQPALKILDSRARASFLPNIAGFPCRCS